MLDRQIIRQAILVTDPGVSLNQGQEIGKLSSLVCQLCPSGIHAPGGSGFHRLYDHQSEKLVRLYALSDPYDRDRPDPSDFDPDPCGYPTTGIGDRDLVSDSGFPWNSDPWRSCSADGDAETILLLIV